MQKIITGITGLDDLFFGGLYIAKRSDNDKLIIVVKGCKGSDKTLFAMQLMYGIAKSLHANFKQPKALFYSLNKLTNNLENRYLNFFIRNWINQFVTQYRMIEYNKNRGDEELLAKKMEGNTILNFLFENYNHANHLIEKIVEQAVYYSMRTSSLHFRRNYIGDDKDNFIAERRYDKVRDYYAAYELYLRKHKDRKDMSNFESNDSSTMEKDLHDLSYIIKNNETLLRNFLYNTFVDCDFLGKDFSNKTFYSPDPMSVYRNAIKRLEDIKQSIDENKKELYDVVVVDGFSQLSNRELQELPYSYIRGIMRGVAKVSILLFDDRDVIDFDGDILIEMRQVSEDRGQYFFREMKIAKSVFQEYIHGWHKYRKFDEEIKIFPSLQGLLSERYYTTKQMYNIGQNAFRKTFEEYINTNKCDDFDEMWSSFSDSKRKKCEKYEKVNKISFENFIIHNDVNAASVVAFVGDFSLTRKMSLYFSYSYAGRNVDTLYVFWERYVDVMRNDLKYPSVYFERESDDVVMKYYDRLHMINMKMGGLCVEEFFSLLLQQISFYCIGDINRKNEQKELHIVIDDLYRMESIFAFTGASSLFLETLVTIAHNHKVKMTILCSPSSSFLRKLKLLADEIFEVMSDSECNNALLINGEIYKEDKLLSLCCKEIKC